MNFKNGHSPLDGVTVFGEVGGGSVDTFRSCCYFLFFYIYHNISPPHCEISFIHYCVYKYQPKCLPNNVCMQTNE